MFSAGNAHRHNKYLILFYIVNSKVKPVTDSWRVKAQSVDGCYSSLTICRMVHVHKASGTCFRVSPTPEKWQFWINSPKDFSELLMFDGLCAQVPCVTLTNSRDWDLRTGELCCCVSCWQWQRLQEIWGLGMLSELLSVMLNFGRLVRGLRAGDRWTALCHV